MTMMADRPTAAEAQAIVAARGKILLEEQADRLVTHLCDSPEHYTVVAFATMIKLAMGRRGVALTLREAEAAIQLAMDRAGRPPSRRCDCCGHRFTDGQQLDVCDTCREDFGDCDGSCGNPDCGNNHCQTCGNNTYEQCCPDCREPLRVEQWQ